VRLRLGHEDQVSVAGDADLLKQLILNLVENAIKYSPPDGTVTLSLAHDDHAARIAVADQGSGIAPEDLPRIFDRFYRARSSGGRIAGGAGIGLAVARWIAEQHGGRIEVESTPGRGSTFTIVLPFSPPLTVL
jgi:signal transduction histidine kinase